MAVNYPYYIPQQQQPQYAAIPYAPQQRMPYVEQPQIGIKGRPVSSIEEVKATSIDFDGSVFFFPDLANKKIYTKQINLDGTSTLNVYELKNIPIETVVNPSQFVTREEFETVLAQLKEKIAPQANKQPTAQQQESKPKLDFYGADKMNPMQLIQMIRNGQNPQQLTLNILESQMGNNPFGANLLDLAKQNKTEEIEQIARNLLSQRGLNYDKEFADFKKMLGL